MDSSAPLRRQDTNCSRGLGLYIDDPGGFDLTQRYIVVTILGISLYNCVELIPFIFATFKRYRGLYFWSLMVSILGIVMCNVSNLVSNFYPNPPRLQVGFVGLVGWALMVTGQSLVLYSRIDLLLLGYRTRRWVLRVIIFNAVAMHVPIIVLNSGSKSTSPAKFLPGFSIYEKVQLIVFFLQEMGLSCLYLWECFRFLVIPDMPGACRIESDGFSGNPEKNSRKVLLHLLTVSIAVIILDITVIVLEFSGYHIIQISYKELAYSIKLKLEISVLSRLKKFVQARPMGSSGHITTQGDVKDYPVTQQAFYPQPHLCECSIPAGAGKPEAGRVQDTTDVSQSQSDHHGGDSAEARPAQEMVIERIA